jgi:hypothetical protein
MKKKLSILIILISVTFGYSQNKDYFDLLSDRVVNLNVEQNKEISELFTNSLTNRNLQLRINRLAISSKYFKIGDEFRISTKFDVNEIGRLVNISVSAPLPRIEQIVENELKSIAIPKDLMERAINNFSELKFSLPIIFYVTSESEILKSMEKDRRAVEKEKKKELRKKERMQSKN